MTEETKRELTFANAPDPKRAKNVKDAIRPLLMQPKVWADIRPFLTNGGVCGHKVMDLHSAVLVIREADSSKGGIVESFGLNDFQLGNALKNTLRERLELSPAWKVVGTRLKLAEAPAGAKAEPTSV